MKNIYVLVSLFLICSCTDYIALDNQKCAGYGFKPNTDKFAECLQREEIERNNRAAIVASRPSPTLNPVIPARSIIGAY